MEKIYATQKFTKQYKEDGREYTITATAQIHSLGGQEPYFSLTGDIRGPRGWEAGGCLHDDIQKHFPELIPFVKWHLVSMAQPLHYVANSLYWAGLSGWCDGKKDSPPNYEHLVSTCKWGTVEGDNEIDLHDYMRTDNPIENEARKFLLTELLNKRINKVQDAFIAAMTELFGDIFETTIK